MASFCKSCQTNNVNTRIEWRPNPDYPSKNKPFDIDKQEWHKCPYYKVKFPPNVINKVEQDVSGPPKVPTTVEGLTRDMLNIHVWKEDIDKEIAELKKWKEDISKAVAQISHQKASDLLKPK